MDMSGGEYTLGRETSEGIGKEGVTQEEGGNRGQDMQDPLCHGQDCKLEFII
jgi:hypothetical protein